MKRKRFLFSMFITTFIVLCQFFSSTPIQADEVHTFTSEASYASQAEANGAMEIKAQELVASGQTIVSQQSYLVSETPGDVSISFGGKYDYSATAYAVPSGSWICLKQGNSYIIWTPPDMAGYLDMVIAAAQADPSLSNANYGGNATGFIAFGDYEVVDAKDSYLVKVSSADRISHVCYGQFHQTTIQNWAFQITYKKAQEMTRLAVQKVWNDHDNVAGKRPKNITIHLVADRKVIQELILNDDNGWKGSFENIPADLNYTVKEIPVEGYIAKVEGSIQEGYTITNTYQEEEPEKMDIPVKKVWKDTNDQVGKRPKNITVHLLANGQLSQRMILNDDNTWQDVFKDVPVGPTYSIEEKAVEGYITTVTGSAKEGFTITNTYQEKEPEKMDIKGQKIWKDGNDQDGLRPKAITVRLLADGKEVDAIQVTAKDHWQYAFTNVATQKEDKKIQYTIQEDAVAGYTTKMDGYNVVNTHTPKVTGVHVQKIWKDEKDAAGKRPEAIQIHLFADGKDTGKILVLNAKNNWNGNFVNLDAYANGKAIVYTVSEQPVAFYRADITGNAKDGYTITNTYQKTPPTATSTHQWGYLSLCLGVVWIFIRRMKQNDHA